MQFVRWNKFDYCGTKDDLLSQPGKELIMCIGAIPSVTRISEIT